jgi:hypothetical protein
MDVKRKNVILETETKKKKHLFLDISSTCPIALPVRRETRRVEIFWLLSQPLPHLVRHHLRLSNILERISGRSCELIYATDTSQRKQETFLYEYPFANKERTTERCSSIVHPRARSPFLLLKPVSEHAHACQLSRLSRSWVALLLSSDTHREPHTPITAVLLPFVNYLLSVLRIYNFADGAVDISERNYKKLTTEHVVSQSYKFL